MRLKEEFPNVIILTSKKYNDISLREQGTLVAEIADRMKRLKHFTNRTKRQYEYFKSLKGTSDSLHPGILKFIEDYEEFYLREK